MNLPVTHTQPDSNILPPSPQRDPSLDRQWESPLINSSAKSICQDDHNPDLLWFNTTRVHDLTSFSWTDTSQHSCISPFSQPLNQQWNCHLGVSFVDSFWHSSSDWILYGKLKERCCWNTDHIFKLRHSTTVPWRQFKHITDASFHITHSRTSTFIMNNVKPLVQE